MIKKLLTYTYSFIAYVNLKYLIQIQIYLLCFRQNENDRSRKMLALFSATLEPPSFTFIMNTFGFIGVCSKGNCVKNITVLLPIRVRW